MQYIQLAMAAIQILTALIKAIQELKANGALSDETLDLSGSALTNLGSVAKIDELSEEKVQAVMPQVKSSLPGLLTALQDVHARIEARHK